MTEQLTHAHAHARTHAHTHAHTHTHTYLCFLPALTIFLSLIQLEFFLAHEGCKETLSFVDFLNLLYCEIKHLEMCARCKYNLMSYYKHLCSYCPSQEEKFVSKLAQRKVSIRLRED